MAVKIMIDERPKMTAMLPPASVLKRHTLAINDDGISLTKRDTAIPSTLATRPQKRAHQVIGLPWAT
jgi:hypothetical protein